MSAKKPANRSGRRVYWKPDEIRKIAEHLVKADAHADDFGFVSKVREYHQKQVLPEERWRPVSTMDHVAEVVAEMKKVKHEQILAKADAARRETEEAERREAEAKEQQLATEAAAAAAAAHKPLQPRWIGVEHHGERDAALRLELKTLPIADTLDLLTETLARQLVARFMYHLGNELKEAVTHEFMPAVEPTLKKAKLIRMKVLVVGLKPNQAGHIVNEFGNTFDLRFVDSSHQTNGVAGKLAGVDKVIGMVNFMSHSTEDQLKKHSGYMRVAGGLDSLRDTLRGFTAA